VAGKRTDQRQKVDLARLLDDVSQGSADHAHSRSVHLSVALPRTNTALEVIGAPVALRRAVTALLDNAIRHASTTVWLSCAEADGEVRIVVTDDGAGVDPEVQPRLFERLASARDAEEWPGAGVSRRHGIGLALVREIAAQHEGTVAWLDQPGRGATFQLTLPPATPSDGQQAGADGRTHR
jgi:signal transduction histidine kinase